MLLPQSLTSGALRLGTREPLSGVVRGGAVLALALAFDRRVIKGCGTVSVTVAAEWGANGTHACLKSTGRV